MKTRVAVIGIIVENPDLVDPLNKILHEYSQYIIGRMGIPYRQHHMDVISIVLDATDNTISSLAGKIGALNGISAKAAYSSAFTGEED
ncbi:MAG: iron-only hydrogenase system regulator [Coriobacteriaceae bacterium]|nr:MAG: iron-only hydrogenase system regulator [Coriobacteriaceae bacterium]